MVHKVIPTQCTIIARRNHKWITEAHNNKAKIRETIVPERHAACKAKPIHVIRALSSLVLRIVRAYEAIPHASDNKEPNAHAPMKFRIMFIK